MTAKNGDWFPLEVVLTYTNLATGQRETRVVEGRQRRNGKLTPAEREKYIRFHRRKKAEAEARAAEAQQSE
jgi:hypothetical protein